MFAAAALFAGSDRAAAAGTFNRIALIDGPGVVIGSYVALDSLGYPVIAYGDVDGHTTKIMHCNDPDCLGGDESIVSLLTPSLICRPLVLDQAGHPVATCYDSNITELGLLHCNDPNCEGGDESITFLDNSGIYSSLALDGAGYPVIGYVDDITYDLRILRCNDPNCSGNDESINSVDTVADVSSHGFLALDNSGHPVVSYTYLFNSALKILHCNDPICAGDDESITIPDVDGAEYTSLQLDSFGNPVVSYAGAGLDGLKVMHCNDPACSGGDESITTADPAQNAIVETALALAADGSPVVAYRDLHEDTLKILRCNDANCEGGDDSIKVPDRTGNVGQQPSIVLDDFGNPVVVYSVRVPYYDVRLLHCGNPTCEPDTDGDNCNDEYELFDFAASEEQGGKRSPKNPYDFYDTNGDGTIDLFLDIFNVAYAFGDDADDMGPGEPDGYDPAFDRSAPLMGDDPWDMQAPDGLIDLFTDIVGVANQFGHTCA